MNKTFSLVSGWSKQKAKYELWLLMAVALGAVLFLAYHPWWWPHLQVDVVTFQSRAVHWLTQGSWENLGYNEYQPGALWYFAAMAALTPTPQAFDAFLATFVLVNLLLLFLHALYFYRLYSPAAVRVFLVIAVATGPILLYRFELLVSLLVLLAWHFFTKHKHAAAAALLGFSTAMKVYPVLLFIPILAQSMRQRLFRQAVISILAFSLGLLIPVGGLVLAGSSVAEISAALEFHQLKPIGLEGLWGEALVFSHLLTDTPLNITPGYGVHGLSSNWPIFSSSFLNLVWLIPVGIILVLFFFKYRPAEYTDPLIPFLLLLVFVVASKVVNPQYLWWFVVFLPMLQPARFGRELWSIVLLCAIGALVLTQVVYPLNYTEFLAWFYQPEENSQLFFLSVVRNILLIAILAVGLGHLVTRARKA